MSQTAQQIVDGLLQQGYLIDLTVSKWAGQARLTEEDLGLEGLTDAELHRLGRRQLVPAEEVAKISRIEQRARQALAHRSYQFPFGGARFVPVKVLGAVLAELNELRSEFEDAVAEFVLRYEGMRSKMHAEWMQNAKRLQQELGKNKAWLDNFEARLNAAYPPKIVIQDSFEIKWSLYQFALPQGLHTKVIGAQEAEEAAKLAAEARRQVEDQVASFVGEAAQELRRRAADLCKHVREQLVKSGNKFSEKSLNPLRELIAEFQSMDFTGDGDFKATLDQLTKEWLGTGDQGTAAAMRSNESYREAFGKALDAVVEKVEGEANKMSEEAVTRFLKFGRLGRAAAHMEAP